MRIRSIKSGNVFPVKVHRHSQTFSYSFLTPYLYSLYLSFWFIRPALLCSVFYSFDIINTPRDTYLENKSLVNVFLLHTWPIAYDRLTLRIRIIKIRLLVLLMRFCPHWPGLNQLSKHLPSNHSCLLLSVFGINYYPEGNM